MRERADMGDRSDAERIVDEALAIIIDEDGPTDDVESPELPSSLDILDVSTESDSTTTTSIQRVNLAAPSIRATETDTDSAPLVVHSSLLELHLHLPDIKHPTTTNRSPVP